MNVIAITGIAIVAAVFCIMLRKQNPEYAMLLSLITGIFIFLQLFTDSAELFDRIQTLFVQTGADDTYIQVLFKALGICFVTQIACDGCRDAGETSIAAKVEIAGKLAVLFVSLPLFEQILSLAASLIGWSGI